MAETSYPFVRIAQRFGVVGVRGHAAMTVLAQYDLARDVLAELAV